jgi:hypothetical protein
MDDLLASLMMPPRVLVVEDGYAEVRDRPLAVCKHLSLPSRSVFLSNLP